MTFKVSESILLLKKAKNLGKYKIFQMAVYMIFKYGKRFRFAPSFNNSIQDNWMQKIGGNYMKKHLHYFTKVKNKKMYIKLKIRLDYEF